MRAVHYLGLDCNENRGKTPQLRPHHNERWWKNTHKPSPGSQPSADLLQWIFFKQVTPHNKHSLGSYTKNAPDYVCLECAVGRLRGQAQHCGPSTHTSPCPLLLGHEASLAWTQHWLQENVRSCQGGRGGKRQRQSCLWHITPFFLQSFCLPVDCVGCHLARGSHVHTRRKSWTELCSIQMIANLARVKPSLGKVIIAREVLAIIS